MSRLRPRRQGRDQGQGQALVPTIAIALAIDSQSPWPSYCHCIFHSTPGPPGRCGTDPARFTSFFFISRPPIVKSRQSRHVKKREEVETKTQGTRHPRRNAHSTDGRQHTQLIRAPSLLALDFLLPLLGPDCGLYPGAYSSQQPPHAHTQRTAHDRQTDSSIDSCFLLFSAFGCTLLGLSTLSVPPTYNLSSVLASLPAPKNTEHLNLSLNLSPNPTRPGSS